MERALIGTMSGGTRAGACRHSGFTLIEVSVAVLILTIGVTAILGAVALGVGVNKAEGEMASRATTYAHAKLEELMLLGYNDTATDTAAFPAADTGGTGLAAGGGVAEGSPVTGYVDYIAEDGARTTAANAFFTRQWSVADNATGNSKTITVAVFSRRVATYESVPSTTLVGIRANN